MLAIDISSPIVLRKFKKSLPKSFSGRFLSPPCSFKKAIIVRSKL